MSHHLNREIGSKPSPKLKADIISGLPYVSSRSTVALPSIYSSSLISQSTDPADQTLLVFPDWKVVHELENSKAGASEIWDGLLDPTVGRSGKKSANLNTVGRRRSWTMPYRAVILLCWSPHPLRHRVILLTTTGSHKRRDKRCHIAAPLLRAAFHTVLEKHDITIDDTGSSLACLDETPLEDIDGTDVERDEEAFRRLRGIEGVSGGPGGEIGIFNINHLGGELSERSKGSRLITGAKVIVMPVSCCFCSRLVHTCHMAVSPRKKSRASSKTLSCKARLFRDFCAMLSRSRKTSACRVEERLVSCRGDSTCLFYALFMTRVAGGGRPVDIHHSTADSSFSLSRPLAIRSAVSCLTKPGARDPASDTAAYHCSNSQLSNQSVSMRRSASSSPARPKKQHKMDDSLDLPDALTGQSDVPS